MSNGSDPPGGAVPRGAAVPPEAVDRAERGEPELLVLPSPDAVAAAAGERIAATLERAARERGTAHFATTGGSSPIAIYRRLAAPPLRDRLPWDRIQVWWGDDRFVPRDHPDSNVLPLDQVLLRAGARSGQAGDGADGSDLDGPPGVDAATAQMGAPLPAANLHPWPTLQAIGEGRDADWCAEQYAREMAAALPVDPAGWPIFDLVIVGVGEDGHVLSCFPGSRALESDRWTLGIAAPTHVGPHLPRVTLNPAVLDAARALIAITAGPGKAAALAGVFGPVRDERRWPAQRARRRGATWIVDEAAAARIPR